MSEGVSRMFIHGMWLDPIVGNTPPGTSWSAGIHVGPSITWMPDGRAFFDYLARCQYLLQSGAGRQGRVVFLRRRDAEHRAETRRAAGQPACGTRLRRDRQPRDP